MCLRGLSYNVIIQDRTEDAAEISVFLLAQQTALRNLWEFDSLHFAKFVRNLDVFCVLEKTKDDLEKHARSCQDLAKI